MSDGDTITAALFNNEYNQLVNAFTYSSSSASSTGHRHDGTAGHGGNIHTIGDLDFLNKIVVDSTNNRWGVFVEVSSAAVEQIRIQDGAIVPVTDNDIDLGTSSLEFKDAYFDGTVTSDAFAGPLTGDVTGNVSGTAATVTTAAQTNITSLGTLTTLTVDNVIVNGTTIGHTSDTDLLTLTSGVLTVAGELDAATLDISGDADIDGTTNLDAVDIDGAVQIDATLTVGVDDTGYDVKFFGDTASAYMLWDTSADDLVLAGAAGLDVAGDIDVDGTSNLDNTDIDGTLAVDGTTISLDATTSLNIDNSNTSNGITIGTATSGVPVSIGHTTSEVTVNDNLTVTGTLTLGSGAELTEAELEMLDGITAGTVAASKAVVVDSNKDAASFRNITLTGELDAGSLDVSGDADIDGTLEADAITIGGVTLAETISDTVGAMVTSNTETGITVTYEDGDNTLDFAIGTLNQDTTGTAAIATTVTITDNESTNEENAVVFTAGGDVDGGNLGLESDGNLTYNPSSGTLTATAFAGALTGNVTGNASGTAATVTGAAQSNITSLGTLTTLTVDNVIVNGTTIGHTSDTDLITLADGNVTIAGELDLTTLDVSGDADIDGTLEADAITIAGVTLSETIADTVGAMVSSNTETNITVTYNDSDNTLDFVATGTVTALNNATENELVTVGATTTELDAESGLTYDGSVLTVSGEVDASSLDISGDADIDGTLETDALSINGTAVTSTAAELNILDGVTSTAAELNILDGATVVVGEINALDLGSTAVGTAIASKAVILDSNKDYTGLRNLTITGELDAATLDISGNVDIDGTLETDNLTVGGAQGSDGQVLTSTGSGVAWEDASGSSAGDVALSIATMTGDASDTTLALGVTPTNENNVQVYFDGVYQNKDSFSISGATLTFGVAPPSGVAVEAIITTTSGSTTAAVLVDADSDTKIQVEESSDEDKIRFDVAGTEEMVMDATGIVINDGSNDRDFRIEGNGQANLFVVDGGTDDIGIGIASPTFATGNGMHFADSFYVGLGTGNGTRPDFSLSGNNSGLAIACGTGSDDADILISTAGVMAVPNGIELGSGTDFTAANTLNDYEEGTWTPTVGGNTAQGSTSSGSVAGKYIKIGKLVFASFSIVNVTIASASGHLKIGGFPFNNDGTNDREAVGVMRVYGVNIGALGTYGTPLPAVNDDTNTAFVLQSGDDAAWNVVQVSNDSGQYFEGSITYITT